MEMMAVRDVIGEGNDNILWKLVRTAMIEEVNLIEMSTIFGGKNHYLYQDHRAVSNNGLGL